jgi:hypothetical protein
MTRYCLTGFVKGELDIDKNKRVFITDWSPGFVTAEIMSKGRNACTKTVNTTQLESITYRKTPKSLEYAFLKIYDTHETASKITASFNRKVGSKSRVKAEFRLYSLESEHEHITERTYHETLILGVIGAAITLTFAWVEIQPFLP